MADVHEAQYLNYEIYDLFDTCIIITERGYIHSYNVHKAIFLSSEDNASLQISLTPLVCLFIGQ